MATSIALHESVGCTPERALHSRCTHGLCHLCATCTFRGPAVASSYTVPAACCLYRLSYAVTGQYASSPPFANRVQTYVSTIGLLNVTLRRTLHTGDSARRPWSCWWSWRSTRAAPHARMWCSTLHLWTTWMTGGSPCTARSRSAWLFFLTVLFAFQLLSLFFCWLLMDVPGDFKNCSRLQKSRCVFGAAVCMPKTPCIKQHMSHTLTCCDLEPLVLGAGRRRRCMHCRQCVT